jgi:multicomponent Na+:H+ antiporter subunit E
LAESYKRSVSKKSSLNINSHKKRLLFINKLKNFLYLFLFLMLVWLALTSTINLQEVTAGVIISLILSLVLSKSYIELGLPPLSIKRIFFSIVYILVLLLEIVRANFDVAYRVIHPKMPIKPGIVTIKTDLKQDIAKLILANSITLTPGTFTLDILGDTLLIHWINVKGKNMKERTKLIASKFERYLRIIFE